MKKITLLLLLALPAAALAAEDCARNADACAGGKKTLSPFAAASLDELKQGQAVKAPELKAAPAKRAPELKPAPAPAAAEEPQAVPAAPAPVPPAPAAAEARKELSSPLWLVFIGGALSGLYFYLRGGARKGRKK